jgi:hypothetical protein
MPSSSSASLFAAPGQEIPAQLMQIRQVLRNVMRMQLDQAAIGDIEHPVARRRRARIDPALNWRIPACLK